MERIGLSTGMDLTAEGAAKNTAELQKIQPSSKKYSRANQENQIEPVETISGALNKKADFSQKSGKMKKQTTI